MQSIIINTVDSIVDQGEKINLWGTNCFSVLVVLTLLECVISLSNLPVGRYQFAILVCCKGNVSMFNLDQKHFYRETVIFIYSRYVLTFLPGCSSGIPEQQYLIATFCILDIVGGLGEQILSFPDKEY